MSIDTAAAVAAVLASHGPGDAAQFIVYADHFLDRGERALAAAALDRAYGLAPEDDALARQRAALVDELALEEHGLRWRFVPAGTTVMGSLSGDPDERPVHPQRVDAFWILDAPITWDAYQRLHGPETREGDGPFSADGDAETVEFQDRDPVRLQYCRTGFAAPRNWHDHADEEGTSAYGVLPMVAMVPVQAEELAARLTAIQAGVAYALPTEAQWEKAARGGLVGKRFAWGDAAPTPATCDFDRMGDFRLLDPRTLPANGYGLFGMCGGVSEWTADRYDALAYAHAARGEPAGPTSATVQARVLRGGGWTDCADAVTVSYRSSRSPEAPGSPTIGFRLVRVVVRAT